MKVVLIILMLLLGLFVVKFEVNNQNEEAKIQQLINEIETTRCEIDMRNNQDIVCD